MNSLQENAFGYCKDQTGISLPQVKKVLELLVVEECTVPFVTRYRKEATGNLDEVQIRTIHEKYEEYNEREKRRAFILDTLKKDNLLTPELEKNIVRADSLADLEAIYAPFKSKKKTKAVLAREAGLQPLADEFLTSKRSLEEIKKDFKLPETIKTWEEALAGATSIIVETMSHNLELKGELREFYHKEGLIRSKLKEEGKKVEEYLKFKDFFDFNCKIKDLYLEKNSHRYLAMKRGATLDILRVECEVDEESALIFFKKYYYEDSLKLGNKEFIKECAKKAFRVSIDTSLNLEIKGELKNLSDVTAIKIFSSNLKNLLLAPYLGAKAVMGVDPGVRTGCKIVVVDDTGKLLVDFVIYPHEPRNDIENSKILISRALEHFKIEYIAIGNGTYGRETLAFLEDHVELVKNGKVKATLISEAGASVYSVSEIGREEFPDKDPTVRGAVSIARRFQDPLAELVKIDPKSIGVGQYQHDVSQTRLKKGLGEVIESCVNYVGVDLNTASPFLLSHISGIGESLAKNIVEVRQKKGPYKKREDLLEIGRFNQKAYQQGVGFLRIYNGENPLDAYFIHPEKYPVILSWIKDQGVTVNQFVADKTLMSKLASDKKLAATIGELTFKDIVSALNAPSADPRSTFKSADFSQKLRKFSDLVLGEWYTGVVNNITQFGAFVDIGIKESGLVHISELSDTYVTDPLEVVKVGQVLKVKVLAIDEERKRISLTCKSGTKVEAPKPSSNHKVSAKVVEAPKNNAFQKLKNFKV